MTSALAILTAALEEIAAPTSYHGCKSCDGDVINCDRGEHPRADGSRCLGAIARAALEAAAKAPGLASDEALVDNASYAVYEATKAAPDMSGACRRTHGDLENIRVARAVLRAVDAYYRATYPSASPCIEQGDT